MIDVALLVLGAYQLPSVPPAPADDIVVMGERMKNWQGRMSPAGDAIRCVTTRSTGDAEVDHIGCSTMVACFAPMRPRLVATTDRRRPAAERRELQTAFYRDLGACLVERRDRLIADLAERRYQSRTGANAAN